jgi:hypothetical protein
VAFSDPIVAGTELIRDAIHSAGYVAGVSGWTINKDGTAEFSNLTARGSMEVTGAPQKRIKVYVKGGIPVIEFRDDDGDIYEIAGYGTANALAFHAGEEATFITEMALDKDGTWRVNSADSTSPTNGIFFEHGSGYLKSRIGVAAETWHAVSYLNGWTDWGAPHSSVAYRLMPDGTVMLRGVAKGGTQTDGTAVFSALPAGYRPTAGQVAFHFAGATSARVDIATSGATTISGMGGLGAGSPLFLDGVRFPVI